MKTTIQIRQLNGIEAKLLFACFYDRIKLWYEDASNRDRFEEWQQKQKAAGKYSGTHYDIGLTKSEESACDAIMGDLISALRQGSEVEE